MDMTLKMKICTKCGETKPVTSFHRDGKGRDGYKSQCKACRGTVTPRNEAKPTQIRPEFKVWHQEYQRVCRCIVCDGKPALPAAVTTVEGARQHVLATPPRCRTHADTPLSLKVRLKANRWPDLAPQLVKTIDLYHLITVVLKNFRHERKNLYADAMEWLAGKRDHLSVEMVEFIEGWIERTSDRALLTHLNEVMPVVTDDRRRTILDWEYSAEAIDDRSRALLGDEGEEDFVSVIDLAAYGWV